MPEVPYLGPGVWLKLSWEGTMSHQMSASVTHEIRRATSLLPGRCLRLSHLCLCNGMPSGSSTSTLSPSLRRSDLCQKRGDVVNLLWGLEPVSCVGLVRSIGSIARGYNSADVCLERKPGAGSYEGPEPLVVVDLTQQRPHAYRTSLTDAHNDDSFGPPM
ncbi:hypothetical protein VTI74DRAFT_1213 [Chaetomium olivicolor]